MKSDIIPQAEAESPAAGLRVKFGCEPWNDARLFRFSRQTFKNVREHFNSRCCCKKSRIQRLNAPQDRNVDAATFHFSKNRASARFRLSDFGVIDVGRRVT